jgi:hypothetical protein
LRALTIGKNWNDLKVRFGDARTTLRGEKTGKRVEGH